MMIFAVDVGERCTVRGYVCRACDDGTAENSGFGKALIWESRFTSKNVAWSSITRIDY